VEKFAFVTQSMGKSLHSARKISSHNSLFYPAYL